MGTKHNHTCWLKKTGETLSQSSAYSLFTDDGFHQMGISHKYTKLDTGQYAGSKSIGISPGALYEHTNAVVVDERTGLMWTSNRAQGPATGIPRYYAESCWDDRCVRLGVDSYTDFVEGSAVIQVAGNGCTSETAGLRYIGNIQGTASLFIINPTGDFTVGCDVKMEDDSATATISSVSNPIYFDIWQWCHECNKAQLGGHSDWRIPNVMEVNSLWSWNDGGNYGGAWLSGTEYFNPALTTVNYMWTSTTSCAYSRKAFVADKYGYCHPSSDVYNHERHKACRNDWSTFAIVLVRGPDLSVRRPCLVLESRQKTSYGFPDDGALQLGEKRLYAKRNNGQYSGSTQITNLPAKGSSTYLQNEVVEDLRTGLMWLNDVLIKGGDGDDDGCGTYRHDPDDIWSGGTPSDWDLCKRHDVWELLRFINNAQVGGHGDWRIPNINELTSITDYGTGNWSAELDGIQGSSTVWGSNCRPDSQGNFDAYALYHPVGGTSRGGHSMALKTNPGRIIVVRGGHTDDDL